VKKNRTNIFKTRTLHKAIINATTARRCCGYSDYVAKERLSFAPELFMCM